MDAYRKLFWFFLAALTCIRLGIIGQFALSPDEAYYWTWSRHLDWCYYDQGPLLALVIRCFTALAGKATEWSVRLGAVLLSCLASWVFFEFIARWFRSTRAAWYGFIAFQSALLISAGAILMMHDSIMICFWILAMYFFYRALSGDNSWDWLLAAITLGCGALAKYSMALFVPCLLLFIALSPEHRHWWKKPQLYLAGLVTLALVSPLILWNAQHHWASFGHIGNLSGATKARVWSWKYPLLFFGSQLGVMTPLIGAFALAAPIIGWKKWRAQSPEAATYLFLTCFSGPILLFFFVLSWHTEIYANWPAPAYPAAVALLAGWLISWAPTKQWRLAQRWAVAAISLGLAITLLVHIEAISNPVPLPGKASDSVNRVHGWSITGQETGRRLLALAQQSHGPVFLAARRYQIAAVVSFYTLGHPEVQLLPTRDSAGNQYQFWDRAAQLSGQNALFVCEDHWEAEHLRSQFERIEPLPPFTVRENGRNIREILFFNCYGFKPSPQPGNGVGGNSRPGEGRP